MAALDHFHDIRFPTDLALGATGGPVRRTEVITLGSGKEQRNSRWANSRRRYNVGYGIRTSEDLFRVIEFFEERRGRLFGFRFRDPVDWKSGSGGAPLSYLDQMIGQGDGSTARFVLTKRYGAPDTGYFRRISKPVVGTLAVAVDGQPVDDMSFDFDANTCEIVFAQATIPGSGAIVTAGYEFDMAVRFDVDEISINLSHFEAGDISTIPVVELI